MQVEWYWQEKTVVLRKKKSQCQFVHHKPHVDWPAIKREPKKPSTNCRSHGTASWCIRVRSSQIQTTVSPSTVVTQLPVEVAIRSALVSTKYYHNPLDICDLPTVDTTYGCCYPGCVICRLFSTTTLRDAGRTTDVVLQAVSISDFLLSSGNRDW